MLTCSHSARDLAASVSVTVQKHDAYLHHERRSFLTTITPKNLDFLAF